MASLRKHLALLRLQGGAHFLSGRTGGDRRRWYSQGRQLAGRVVRSPYPDITIPAKTYTQLIWERHSQWAHRTAVECGITGEGYTYEELLELAEDLGAGLQREAGGVGEVVAFLLANSPEYVAALLGASRAGLVVCSINPLYTPDEIGFQLKNAGARSVVTHPDKLSDVLKAVGQLEDKGGERIQVICTRGEGGLVEGLRSLEDLARMGRSVAGGGGRVPTDALAFISHSSGTTGLPKGVCLSHANVTASILQMAHPQTTAFRETDGTHQDVIPMVLPIFHNFGLEMTLDALYHGSKIVTLPKFEDRTFLATMKKHKSTMLFAVPPMLLFLGQREDATREHLQHLRLTMAAAAPIGRDDLLRYRAKAPSAMVVLQGYGATEAMCYITQTPDGVDKVSSVGIPMVNTEVRVVDVRSGETLPAYQEGELCFRGPQMSLGYLNNPKATEESRDAEGWYHTGDVAYYDSEGYFYIVDRIKELIKVKGYQVAPAELEAVLRSHPEVEDVGVTGMPDERKGEVPVGFVKLKPQAKVTGEDLNQFLAQKVAPYKLINKYIFVNAIPKSPSGKILRKDLKNLLNIKK